MKTCTHPECQRGNGTERSIIPLPCRFAGLIEPATNARTSTLTPTTWPRNTVKTIETRKRDVVIRIADWTRDTDEPAYDVEVYVHGVYDQNESACFTRWQIQHTQPGRPNGRPWKIKARVQALEFARTQLAKHLA